MPPKAQIRYGLVSSLVSLASLSVGAGWRHPCRGSAVEWQCWTDNENPKARSSLTTE